MMGSGTLASAWKRLPVDAHGLSVLQAAEQLILGKEDDHLPLPHRAMAEGLGQVALASAARTAYEGVGRVIDKATWGEFLDKGMKVGQSPFAYGW